MRIKRVFILNHCSVHLLEDVGCQSYTTISQSQQWAFTISHAYSSVALRGVKNRAEKSLLRRHYLM